jgi:HSP20 family protein
MKLIKRKNCHPVFDPFSEFDAMHQFFEGLFPATFAPAFQTNAFGNADWNPAIDVSETKEQVLIKADLPGLKKEDIDVTLKEDQVIIKGEKQTETETKDKSFYRLERRAGRFIRTVRLPSIVDAQHVKAVYQDGVLTLTLPKKEEAKEQQVKIDIK